MTNRFAGARVRPLTRTPDKGAPSAITNDSKTRGDVRYILTYVAPSLGYESQAHNPVIQDVIDAYPNQRIIMTSDVAETATGHDRAALIDKFGSGAQQQCQRQRAASHRTV